MSAVDRDADVPGMLAPQRVAIGILGPVVIGWSINLWLSGIAFTLFYDYYRRGRLARDSMFAKTVAISTFVLNSWTGFYCGIALFYWSTTQKRTSVELWGQTSLDCLQPLWIGLTGFLVQLWFARRSTMLFQANKTARGIFIGVIGTFMIASLAGAIGNTYANFLYANGVGSGNIELLFAVTNSFWLWSSSIVDCLNSATLCYLLKSHVAGFNERTDSVLKKMIKLALETACYTATFSSIAAITSVTTNISSYYVSDINYVFFSPLPSLYAISLFTTMASRDELSRDLARSPITGYRATKGFLPTHHQTHYSCKCEESRSRHAMSFVNVEVNVEVKEDVAVDGDDEAGTEWERIKERREALGTMSLRPDDKAFHFLS